MRFKPLDEKFLAELRETERKATEARNQQLCEQQEKELSENKLRVAGLRAEKEWRRIHAAERKKQRETFEAMAKANPSFVKGQVLGRYKVISDGEMYMQPQEVTRGLPSTKVIRVRCVCGQTGYMKVSYAKQAAKKSSEWGCQSKTCLNNWRAAQAKKRKR